MRLFLLAALLASDARAEYHTVIVGGGPAGLGPLYYAAFEEGRLEALLDKGVLIIERSSALGGGQFSHLDAMANSFGSAFSDLLNKPNVAKLFPRSFASPLLPQVNVSRVIKLSLVAEFLEFMASELVDIMAKHPRSRVVLNAEVKEIEILESTQLVTYEAVATKMQYSVEGANVVVTMGAYEDTSKCMNDKAGYMQYSVKDCGFKALVASHTLLGGVDAFLQNIGDAPVVIIGGAHSAWSSVMEIERRQLKTDVTVVVRTPPPSFYYSAEEAQNASYAFDALSDGCPVTGRINRFGGIRGEQRDLYASRSKGIQGEHTNTRTHKYGKDEDAALCGKMRDAVVVCATGYKARWPRFRSNGKIVHPIEPLNTASAQLVTDAGILPRVFAYGLGAGLYLTPSWGGEKKGFGFIRADGVWIYEWDIGKVVYQQLVNPISTVRKAQWWEIYNKKAQRLDPVTTPLHKFGGYDMFTWEQWQDQIGSLVAPLNSSLGRGANEAPVSVFEVGVGAGAFISALGAHYPEVKMYGVDSAQETVRVAKQRVNGTFFAISAEDLQIAFEPKSFDCVVSFGVETYLESEAIVRQKFMDMIRLARKSVYIGEVSDLEKKHIADAMRKKTHVNQTGKQENWVSSYTPPHLYVTKKLFTDVGKELGINVEVRDHDDMGLTYPTAKYRFSVYADLSVSQMPTTEISAPRIPTAEM